MVLFKRKHGPFCKRDSLSYACKISFYFQGNRRGSTHLSKCSDCEGKEAFKILVCNLFSIFLYFCFCRWSLAFDKSRNMYIKSSYVQILSLVSYMLRLFFQKITWIYANWDKNKDVQNKVLNVYCTVYSICLIRRVNVSIVPVGFRVKVVNVYSGFVSDEMADHFVNQKSQHFRLIILNAMTWKVMNPYGKDILFHMDSSFFSAQPPSPFLSHCPLLFFLNRFISSKCLQTFPKLFPIKCNHFSSFYTPSSSFSSQFFHQPGLLVLTL